MTLSHGMPASELPTPSTLSRDDVDSLLDPNAKGGPELRPNAWLTEEIIRLEAAIGSGDPLEAAFARIDLSFRLANKEPGRSLELAAEALRAAEELGNERAIARGHLCVGWGIYNTNPTEWRKASEHGLDAEYAFHDLDERIWEAHAMILRLGLAGYTGVRSVASALEGPIFELLREPCGDEYLRFLGLGRLTLSLTYFATDTDSTLEAARRYLALTVAYARAAPEPIHVGQVQQVVGDLLRMAGDPARARAHFSRAVRIAAKHGASMVTLNAMRGQADCFLDEHDIDAAKEVLEEIRKLVGSDLRFYLAGSMASYLEFKILKAERKWDAAEQVSERV